MSRKYFLSLMLGVITSCGGGTDESSSAISGSWRGDLFQGVISCSDGTFIGAGGGSVIDTVELDVTGADEIESSVQVLDDNCLMQGTRDADGFKADAISGCEQGFDYIRFIIVSENEADLSYHYDIDKVPAGESGVRCVITPSGRVTR